MWPIEWQVKVAAAAGKRGVGLLHPYHESYPCVHVSLPSTLFVSGIAIFVLKRDVKLQLTNYRRLSLFFRHTDVTSYHNLPR